MTFHAVFAKGEATASTPGNASTEIVLSKEETTGWTISGTNTQTNYWVLTPNAYIESPAVELSTELRNVQCSADRSGYFIYQSDKKFTI